MTLVEHVEGVLARVERHELRVRALVPETRRRERVLGEAEALRDRFPEPSEQTPLYGALVGIKDIFTVAGLPTACGSALPPEAFESAEASCVTRFRAAGGLVLGKTITTEFAFFSPGATTNPHDAGHTPGGSSSGSAAAVASGYVPIAFGSQTVGSVIRPAAFCGVVGFKPSYGRIPGDGMLSFSRSVDCPGLLAVDLATVFAVAAVVIEDWSSTVASADMPTVGVPTGVYLDQVEAGARAAFESQLALLARSGVEVKQVALLDDYGEIADRHQDLIAAEFARTHSDRFARWGSLYSGHSAGLYDRGLRLGEHAILSGRQSSRDLRSRLESLMDEHGIDLWATPAATGPAPSGLDSTGDPRMNLIWTHALMPALTFPMSNDGGLPLGLQLAARVGDDERLLVWAQACAAALGTA